MGKPQLAPWVEHINRVTADFAPVFEKVQVWDHPQDLNPKADLPKGAEKEVDQGMGTTRLKYQTRQRFPPAPTNAIPMWIADMDTHPLSSIVERCTRFLSHEYGYQQIDIGQPVSTWYQTQGVMIAPHSVVGVASVISGIDLALSLLAQPGDKVMLLSPTYGPLAERICSQQLNLIHVPVFDMDENLLNSREKIKQQLDPDAKALVVCHPNNPTGTVLPTYIQHIIADFCDTHGITLISDEVHSEFGFVGEGYEKSVEPFAYGCLQSTEEERGCPLMCGCLEKCECPENGSVNSGCPEPKGQGSSGCLKNGIHFNSVSKAFNLAAIPGASYAIIEDEQLRERFSNEVNARHLTASPMSIVALKEAYQQGLPWLNKVRSALQLNRQYTHALLQGLPTNVPFTMGEAGYFLWLDLRQHFPVKPFESACERGVIGVDGAHFNAPGFIRLNLACHPHVIGEALKRLFS